MKGILVAFVVAFLVSGYVAYRASIDEQVISYEPQEEVVTGEQTLFIPSGYRRLVEDNTIVLDVNVLPGTLNSIWAIYGKSPENLDLSTIPQSSELGMGTAGEYGWYSIVIAPEDLEPGISYYYKIVGETSSGRILYSGLNSFTAGK